MTTNAIGADPQGGIQASGDVATRLLQAGMNLNAFRTLDTLRKDEWQLLDTTIVQETRDRLRIAQRLRDRGMVFPLGGDLGVTVLQWQEQNDPGSAELTMDGVTRGRSDRPEFNLRSLPLPISHSDFYLNTRELQAGRRMGTPIDTTMARVSARRVAEQTEDLIVVGSSLNFGGGSIQGLTNATNRTTGSFSAGTWSAAARTGAEILADVLAMIGDARADAHYGPYELFIPQEFETKLDEDFDASSADTRTIRERLMQIEGLEAITVLDRMATDNVVLVQMTPDVLDLVVGQEPRTVEWESEGGFRINMKVFGVMVPRIKDTFANRSGIVHYTP